MRVRSIAVIRFLTAATMIAAPNLSFAAGPTSYAFNLGKDIRRIVEGDRSIAPFASVVFCTQHSDQCSDTGGDDIIELTQAKKDELLAVNSGVNRAIRPQNDPAGRDEWNVDVSEGDCEDYALTKRKHLLSLGWSSRALRIAVAMTSSGEGHAVLVVKTSLGDLVLDNRTSQVRDWTKTGLRWVKIQSADPRVWMAMSPRPAPLFVASARTAPIEE